jgi:hypothetical protein
MADCLAACESQAPASLTWGTTGPTLATRVFLERGLVDAAVAPDVFCPVDFWRVADLLGPPLAPGPRWHAIHFWNEMWRAGNLDKDARYRPDCLYESLKRRYGI